MKKIAVLKQQMSQSKELYVPIKYFFDLIEDIDDLPSQGHTLVKEIDNQPDLFMVIQIVMQQISDFLKKPVKILAYRFYVVADEYFYHGSLILQGIPVPILVLYCSDLHLGITSHSDRRGNVNYFRFSFKAPEDNKTIH